MPQNPVVEIIGQENFKWLSGAFDRETALKDLPDEILQRVASVDVTVRNFVGDRNAVTAIALITFAYSMAGKEQNPQLGPKDVTLLKVLAKNEMARRENRPRSEHVLWNTPLFELITGEIGERVRAMKMLNSPV